MIGNLSKTNHKLTAARRCACWFWCCAWIEFGKDSPSSYDIN